MKDYLLDPKTLKEWVGYSLKMRTLLIEKKFGVKISTVSLGVFYRDNKVTCRKPQYQYAHKEKKQANLIIEQKKVA